MGRENSIPAPGGRALPCHPGAPLVLRDGMPTPAGDLVRAMAGGDREAFARFYDRYAALVFPVLLRVVRDRADAVEVLQDVFWEAWRDAAAYDEARGTAEAWILLRARTR